MTNLGPIATPPPMPAICWGDATLVRAIRDFSSLSALEARHMYAKLLQATLAVPLNPDEPSDGPDRFRFLQEWSPRVLPVFTHPDLLVAFCARVGWTQPDGSASWAAVPGRDFFAMITQYAGAEVVVNPDPEGLRISRQGILSLSQGLHPELPATPTPLPRKVDLQRQFDFLPAGAVSPEVVSSLEIALEGLGEVISAVLFRHTPPTLDQQGILVLGLKFRNHPGADTQRGMRVVQRWLSQMAKEPVEVMTLDYETECSLGSRIKPFYRRQGY